MGNQPAAVTYQNTFTVTNQIQQKLRIAFPVLTFAAENIYGSLIIPVVAQSYFGNIFSGGMILEDSGEVKIYYGAADTVECLATCDVNDLLKFVKNEI